MAARQLSLVNFQKDLGLGRERIKYENLLIKSNYITKAEAERDYHTQNDVAEAKYLYVPFFAISDSAITVSDSDLRAYYNRTKARYKAEQMRNLNYVAFSIEASAEDSFRFAKILKHWPKVLRLLPMIHFMLLPTPKALSLLQNTHLLHCQLF